MFLILDCEKGHCQDPDRHQREEKSCRQGDLEGQEVLPQGPQIQGNQGQQIGPHQAPEGPQDCQRTEESRQLQAQKVRCCSVSGSMRIARIKGGIRQK